MEKDIHKIHNISRVAKQGGGIVASGAVAPPPSNISDERAKNGLEFARGVKIHL